MITPRYKIYLIQMVVIVILLGCIIGLELTGGQERRWRAREEALVNPVGPQLIINMLEDIDDRLERIEMELFKGDG